jgi:hypothetical protein
VNYKTDVLIFVEDPSVANYVASLPQVLSAKGFRSEIYATGTAIDCLSQREISFKALTLGSTADDILSSSWPRSLVIGTAENPETVGLPLIAAARQKGIPTIGIVDAAMNADRRFRGCTDNALAYAPDWMLVPDHPTRQLFSTLGYPEGQIVVCGHPQYDYVAGLAAQWQQEDFTAFRRRVFPQAAEGQQIIIFVSERSVRAIPLSDELLAQYTFKGRGTSRGRTEIVFEEFLEAVSSFHIKPYIVLRVHPKDSIGDFDVYQEEINIISHGGSALEMIYAADIVVGMTSMLLTEAVIMGRKTLSIIPVSGEKAWLPSVRNGLTPCVTNREELKITLKKLLENVQDKSERCIEQNKFVFGAASRIISLIEKVIQGNHIPSPK